jgi:O-antigen/teichoic acid export membrane protein
LFLARGLQPVEFGTFALLNAVILVALSFQANVIVSPLVVLAAPASAAEFRTYTTSALGLTLALLPVTALAIFLASASLHREATGLVAIVYVFAWQLQETTRRSLTSRLRYRDAIWGDAISYLGQALLVGLLFMRPGSTLSEAFAIMGATSLVAAALQCWQARLVYVTWEQVLEAAVSFWNLGKWLAVGSAMGLALGPLYPWLVSWFHGRESAAAFQAVLNVVSITNPIILSIQAIVVPATATFLIAHDRRTNKSVLGLAMRYVLQLELVLAPVFLVLALWPHRVLALFYGKDSVYCNETIALRVAVVATMLLIPQTVLLAAFTGAGRTKRNTVVVGAGTAVALVSAPPLIFADGVVGGIVAMAISRSACVLLAIRLLLTPTTEGPIVSVCAAEEENVGL